VTLYQIVMTKESGAAMQENALTTRDFLFRDLPVRVVEQDGEVWFRAEDVCSALGYANHRDALSNHVDADDVAKRDATDALGRTQQANYVNESGVYALIFGSTKPEAKVFKRWVTHDVLPAIRKTGRYAVQGLVLPDNIQHLVDQNPRKTGFCLSAKAHARKSTSIISERWVSLLPVLASGITTM